MIKFFRKIRQRLLSESKFSKYLLYAIGEIALVMIGILLALQVNNWNELRKERGREVGFLHGLKTDLLADQRQLDYIIERRTEKVANAIALLKEVPLRTHQEVFAADSMIGRLFGWVEFVPQRNTFDELVSSGNLSIISNDSIKNMLLGLKQLQDYDHTYSEHMRREFDHYLYDRSSKLRPAWPFGDLEASFLADSLIQKDLSDKELAIVAQQTEALLYDLEVKNGLRLAAGNNIGLRQVNRNMLESIQDLIDLIDQDINSIK
ncbi:MAG: hypothetical protein HKO93_00035 [Flavobacteriales bacterium]|nr:hypothetical protein [Flavobacteriales bacterium]